MMKPAKEKALAALLTHSTKEDAAKAAGISSRTLRKYLAEPDFQAEYKRAFAGLVDDATRQAQRALTPALKCLMGIVEDTEETSTARIAASRTLLEYGMRLTEFNDILPQVQDAEEGSGQNVL